MNDINAHIIQLRQQLAEAELSTGRQPGSVTLLAISKTQPPEAIRTAYATGQRHFGENYLQEALLKIEALSDLTACWHFVGPIQSNKTQAIAARFDWVHSIDRSKIAERLNDQRPADKPPLQVCIQVNIGAEATKSGVSIGEIAPLAAAICALPRLKLRGLMAIPEPTDDPAQQRTQFAALRDQLQALNNQGYGLDTLSMGMSDDWRVAVAEGATIIRLGTSIFGKRV